MFFLFSFNAYSNCGKFKTCWVQERKTREKTEELCIDEMNKGLRIFSSDCYPLIQKSCPFSALKKGKAFSEMFQPIGSPGFNLCHSLEGSPQMYEIKIGSDWKNVERCFWKKTKSFVDLSELIEFYKAL
jgi:hypothetical protein